MSNFVFSDRVARRVFLHNMNIYVDIDFIHFHLLMFIKHSESDYAVITREFEDHVDDKVLEAMRSATSADAVVLVGATVTATANVDNPSFPAP